MSGSSEISLVRMHFNKYTNGRIKKLDCLVVVRIIVFPEECGKYSMLDQYCPFKERVHIYMQPFASTVHLLVRP